MNECRSQLRALHLVAEIAELARMTSDLRLDLEKELQTQTESLLTPHLPSWMASIMEAAAKGMTSQALTLEYPNPTRMTDRKLCSMIEKAVECFFNGSGIRVLQFSNWTELAVVNPRKGKQRRPSIELSVRVHIMVSWRRLA